MLPSIPNTMNPELRAIMEVTYSGWLGQLLLLAIAQDPATPDEILTSLYLAAPEMRPVIALNPSITPGLMASAMAHYPDLLQENPAWGLWSLEDPSLIKLRAVYAQLRQIARIQDIIELCDSINTGADV